MKRTIPGGLRWIAVLTALAMPIAASGAGFGIFEMGSKATGMGGAFTATADDPSALFYNPAGIAFLDKADFYGGTTLIRPQAELEGHNPYPGEGSRAKLESPIFTPIGIHYVQPLSSSFVAGLGVFTPFGLATRWQDKYNFSGRFISQRAELKVISIQPTIAWKISDEFGLAVGAEYRMSSVALERDVPKVNPYTQTVVDIAHVKLESSGNNSDWGFAAGMLYKPAPWLRLGVSYRHHIDGDIEGKAKFTQIPTGYPDFDAAVAAALPFDQKEKVATSVAFPSMASVGIATDVASDMTVEVDANWTGWNRFQKLDINFADRSDLNSSTDESYKNSWNYRIGFEQRYPDQGCAFRLGFVYDQTPLPNKTVGPLLPDADRVGYSIGYGHNTATWGVDIAYMYLTIRKSQSKGLNTDHFEGTYDSKAHLLGIHARYRF